MFVLVKFVPLWHIVLELAYASPFSLHVRFNTAVYKFLRGWKKTERTDTSPWKTLGLERRVTYNFVMERQDRMM